VRLTWGHGLMGKPAPTGGGDGNRREGREHAVKKELPGEKVTRPKGRKLPNVSGRNWREC